MRTLAACLMWLPALSFADPLVDTITPDNTLTESPSEWLGDAPHFVVMGTVDGFPFDVQYVDLASADVHNIAVKREYETSGDRLNYLEIDFSIQAVIDGIAKTIEGKFNHADFNALASLPATLTVQSEENPAGDLTYQEFEFEWEGNGTSVNAEIADWAGQAVIALDSGFGKAEAVSDGLVGAYMDATHGEDRLVISLTLPVNEAAIDD